MSNITPNLWFKGNAEEAVDYYMSIFKGGRVIARSYYPTQGLLDFQVPLAGKVLTIDFEILGHQFTAINAGDEFTFNESISMNIACSNQQEIDYYWDRLISEGGSESVCGWCKDKYGLSWQVNPANMNELMEHPGAWDRMLQMTKIVISELIDE